jgi:hypothetical protein
MGIKPLWHRTIASSTIASTGDSLFVLLRPATTIRIVALYTSLVVLFWLALYLL